MDFLASLWSHIDGIVSLGIFTCWAGSIQAAMVYWTLYPHAVDKKPTHFACLSSERPPFVWRPISELRQGLKVGWGH